MQTRGEHGILSFVSFCIGTLLAQFCFSILVYKLSVDKDILNCQTRATSFHFHRSTDPRPLLLPPRAQPPVILDEKDAFKQCSCLLQHSVTIIFRFVTINSTDDQPHPLKYCYSLFLWRSIRENFIDSTEFNFSSAPEAKRR